MNRWRWRGNVALVGVALAFFLYPLLPNVDVINSDWPAFDTGARLIVSDPAHLYDLDAQRRVELEVTGGRALVSLGIHGILPFLAPAYVALIAIPFDAFGPNIGGRLWMLFGLLCILAGLYLANRGRSPTEFLPAFAGVPTALVMVNAQIDGFFVLGVGAAMALWPRRYLAGLALGLTLVKPQLVLAIGVALLLLVAHEWKVIAGWATAGVGLLAATLALNPHWIFDWLGQTRATVQTGAREVDLPHWTVLLPDRYQGLGLAVLTALALAAVLWLASRKRGQDMRPGIAILLAGGVLAAPHALPADMLVVGMAMAIWGQARWFEWLALSLVTLLAALTPAPIPAVIGPLMTAWICLRIAELVSGRSREPASATAR